MIYVGVDKQIAGAIGMKDDVRQDAASTVSALKRMGIQTSMLSGDKQSAAEAIASEIGIDLDKVSAAIIFCDVPSISLIKLNQYSLLQVHAGVKPRGKAEFVRKLQLSNHKVAMVGDGVNDAAALAQADVGMAMGSGVGAASEVASVVLMGDRLSQVSARSCLFFISSKGIQPLMADKTEMLV